MTLHIYHPNTNTWESPNIPVDWSNVPAPGTTGKAYVRHAVVFDPNQNVLVFLGGTDDNGASGHFYMFLYRYPAGSPTTPTLSVSPSSLSFSGAVGGSNPVNQNLSVSNVGGGTL